MPVVINKLVFSHIPRQSPALIRPLVKSVFSAIEKKMLMPQLKAHCELVSRVIAPSMPTIHSYALTLCPKDRVAPQEQQDWLACRL